MRGKIRSFRLSIESAGSIQRRLPRELGLDSRRAPGNRVWIFCCDFRDYGRIIVLFSLSLSFFRTLRNRYDLSQWNSDVFGGAVANYTRGRIIPIIIIHSIFLS